MNTVRRMLVPGRYARVHAYSARGRIDQKPPRCIQQSAEDGIRVEAMQRGPVDAAIARNQRGAVAVADQRVVFDLTVGSATEPIHRHETRTNRFALPDLALSAHRRNPPGNASALSPRRHRGGSCAMCCGLPPPNTTSSGCSAAVRRTMTSVTRVRHLLLPSLLSAASPT